MADQPLSSTELLLLESWVVDNPGSRQFLRLAQAYVERERDEEAAEVLERGLVMNPDLLQARWMLGRVLERLGDHTAATRQLESAARQITRQAGLFSDLARLMRKAGRESEARQSLDIAKALGARTPTEAPPVPLPQLEGPAEQPETREEAAAEPAAGEGSDQGDWEDIGPADDLSDNLTESLAESPAEPMADSFADDVWAEPEDALPAEKPPRAAASPRMRLMERLGSWEKAAALRSGRPEPG